MLATYFAHGGGKVEDANPSTDTSRLSDSTTAALVKQTHSSPEVVRDLYRQEIAAVGAAAKARNFIGVIAGRRVKQRLMAALNLKKSSDN
jgi:hypothetical protein